MPKKSFVNIVIQSKDDREDFRAFAHVIDSEGVKWELRGSGRTVGEAAQEAWNAYVGKEEDWDTYGYAVDSF